MRWISKPADSLKARVLAAALGNCGLNINSAAVPVLADLLVQRGIEEPEAARRFLVPELAHLHDPLQMSGMKAALDRLEAAVERKEKILIYGDYDVDGTTAIVILKTAIELCGGVADFHVPHRIREGYGMRDEVIERAAADGVRLIVSVDTGIRAFAAAETARRTGVDLIVTDHHLPGHDGVPQALAVVNPNRDGCDYPCKYLCGAGVAFKLAQGLMQRRLDAKDQSRLLMSFMKVVAIATIADAVPLLGENRVFASLGLKGLRSPVNVGLKALLEVAKLGDGRALTATDVGFRIAPRLNAAGRMDVAHDVVELFSVKDIERARQIAARLDQLNAERQEEERRILDSIERKLEEEPALRDAYCMVIEGEGWHRGVIGITATRVVEKYGRPALVLSREGEESHGSGRSIPAFHLLNALESCHGLFSRYGGHAHAVGFALPAANVQKLCQHLDTYARARLTLADFEPQLEFDAGLPLEEVTPELHQALRLLEPFGMDNPEPVFTARAVRLMAPPQQVKEKHVRLRVAPAADGTAVAAAAQDFTPRCHPDAADQAMDLRAPRASSRAGAPGVPPSWRRNITFKAMGWGLKESCEQLHLLAGDRLDIAYTLGMNDHPEFGGLELTVRDLTRTRQS
ncbi:MAG: single-stranded-DNA-specific exonuclease RecJ [Acidobacteriales bacterium]|nr:single-stranded-DNA-specific exonuclease RecJ [Candidatus Koribacter versatilis]MBI3646179.1 single-stranded-DNA-specific exonuclease RecJ [Terriglobales bacterium]